MSRSELVPQSETPTASSPVGVSLSISLLALLSKKEGPAYDLPIAVGIFLSSEQIEADCSGQVFLGELSLDGSLRHTHGILPMVALAKEKGMEAVFVPSIDTNEASLIEGVNIVPIDSLSQLASYLRGDVNIPFFQRDGKCYDLSELAFTGTDIAHIRGQEHVKRALEVAAAGGHNLRMTGPPGSGKALLARSVPSILPKMTIEEALEVTKIYNVSGMLPTDMPLVSQRPFRAPHHTMSHAGLAGGGHWPRPGEISLSYRGVLFLDELPDFGQAGLENMRSKSRWRTTIAAGYRLRREPVFSEQPGIPRAWSEAMR